MFLLFCTSAHNRASEDLWSRYECSACSERSPRQLLGCNTHGEIIRLATCSKASVLLWNREAEPADLCHTLEDRLRYVFVVAMNVLSNRANLVLRKSVERVAHQIKLIVEVSRASSLLHHIVSKQL